MLFRAQTLQRIAKGEITVAFRRWALPRAKAGGRQRTPVGELRIDMVEAVREADIGESDARLAGFANREALLADPLLQGTEPIWRIAFTHGPDPRSALRLDVPGAEEADTILARLAETARRAEFDPLQRLAVIAANPGRRAPDLAAEAGVETQVFKRQIRWLKEQGLTESLATGYRLSPRGQAVLDRSRS
ncbi:hypothetical protein GVY41_04090 [Frigidibacter albus]|uniref:ASCH domain-containing protein n=1 Tax=Frigidibacter albus TaxID=1465486 RepID=A0A6L8VEG9_9RHOB|nr:hypothetical protein [Frigidibacter albus]MZQ88141.1 hypothetical protein [Frigidibacter albus]NBE30185.1 hypothetical protein [Frigidibacter albus]GGH47235.1 hypothetical protein GCM10011341_08240 [Frigidibacter albus]